MKRIVYPIIVTILTTVFLYALGSMYEISFFRWDYEVTTPDRDGFMVEYGGSLLPILIGIFAGLVTEKILKRKVV